MIFAVNIGIQEAAAAVIGNQVGTRNVQQAKKYAKTVYFNALAITALVSILVNTYRYEIIALFTSDKTLTSNLLSVISIFCVFNLFDSMIMTFQGCVRALGIQTQAAIIAIASYYLVSVPMACILAFTHLFSRLTGTIRALWIGNYIGVFVQLAILAVLTIRADWQLYANQAYHRMLEDTSMKKRARKKRGNSAVSGGGLQGVDENECSMSSELSDERTIQF